MIAKTLALVFALLGSQTWADEACLQEATSLLQVSIEPAAGKGEPAADKGEHPAEIPQKDKVELAIIDDEFSDFSVDDLDKSFEEARARNEDKHKHEASPQELFDKAAVAREAIKASFIANQTADDAVAAADKAKKMMQDETQTAIDTVTAAKAAIQAVEIKTERKTAALAELHNAQKQYTQMHANDTPEQKAAAQKEMDAISKEEFAEKVQVAAIEQQKFFTSDSSMPFTMDLSILDEAKKREGEKADKINALIKKGRNQEQMLKELKEKQAAVAREKALADAKEEARQAKDAKQWAIQSAGASQSSDPNVQKLGVDVSQGTQLLNRLDAQASNVFAEMAGR